MTQNTQHTPAPWWVDHEANPLKVRSEKRLVCLMQGRLGEKHSRDLMEANANLIAAAPELYSLLKECLDGVERGCHEWNKEARSALAKAEGKL